MLKAKCRLLYQPIIEESVYLTNDSTDAFLGKTDSSIMVGVSDVAIQKTAQKQTDNSPKRTVLGAVAVASPIVVELPVQTTFRQRFIEIRNSASQEVVTVIEVLSPANKRGEGRLR